MALSSLRFARINDGFSQSQSAKKVLDHCLHDHGMMLHMHTAIVMPDHAHLLFTPLNDSDGFQYSLAQIHHGIKGSSAHTVNRMLNRRGSVWQDESFDHVLRNDEDLFEKAEYICQNPMRNGLISSVDDYHWIWREWIDDVAQSPSTG